MCPVLVMPYVNALIDQLFEPWFHIETDHGSSCTIGRVCVELIGWKALASQSLEEVSASSSQGDHLFWVPIDERKSRQKNDFFAEKNAGFQPSQNVKEIWSGKNAFLVGKIAAWSGKNAVSNVTKMQLLENCSQPKINEFWIR